MMDIIAYPSMLGLKFIHVSKRGPSQPLEWEFWHRDRDETIALMVSYGISNAIVLEIP